MNYVSLFSGVGGFDLALDRAGHTCLAQVEKDAACRGVLEYHWRNVPRFDDVLTFGKEMLDDHYGAAFIREMVRDSEGLGRNAGGVAASEMERGGRDRRRIERDRRGTVTVDIVCGGSPCQSFSVAGKRGSLDDARGNLAFEFVRICDELQPRYVIWENVPGVLSTKDNAFGCFLAALVGADTALVPTGKRGRWTNAGVVAGPKRTAAWIVRDAQYFGVPQRRRRVFVVASAGTDGQSAPEILFESEGERRYTPPQRTQGQSVTGTVAASVDARNDRIDGDTAHTLQAKKQGYSLNAQPIVAVYQWASGGGNDLKDTAQSLRAGAETNYQIVAQEPVAVKIDNTKSNGWGVLDDGTTHSLGGSTDAVAQVFDARGNGDGAVVPNLTGDPANRITDYTPVVVQQNTRDEVRLVNGDGQIAGALSGELGMKQQNYVVQKQDRIDRWVDEEDKIRAIQGDGHSSTAQEHVYFKPNAVVNALERARAPKVIQQNAVGDPDTANSLVPKNYARYDRQIETVVAAQHRNRIILRRLMPIEAERLQAFPDGFTAHRIQNGKVVAQADTQRYKQLGNAVCVNVVEWIARRLA